jgi:uncharacterized protein (DUF736 family)
MENGDYVSYLLRLRKSEAHGRPTWRVTLESVQTGEQWNWGLEGLLAFLQARFGAPPAGADKEASTGRAEPEAKPAPAKRGQCQPPEGGDGMM